MANQDLSALSTDFVKFGGPIMMKEVNAFDAKAQGIMVYKNVKAPIPLPKISAVGGPRPYRAQDDTSGNGVAWTDRTLTVRQSKWDMDFDPEVFRNQYLNDGSENPYYQVALQQIAKEYLAAINDSTAYLGQYNAAGTAANDLADGWGTLIAADIGGAAEITVTATGAITSANAVTKVELVAKSVPVWMRNKGFRVKVSYDVFDKFLSHYRTLNGFQYQPNQSGSYKIDGINAILEPASWMGSSQRIIAVTDNNLCMGTDGESVTVHASVRRNIIEVRPMMPIGFQIADLAAIVVNDQA